ncbi:MAG: CvpA family protein, partial [Phycisphaerae bacterium]|nr:CvpA family protein [Phycisphaerae bacterium]
MFVDLVGLLILLIVTYINSLEGLFRASITFVCGVLAGAAAFGFYGPLSGIFFSPATKPPTDRVEKIWVFGAEPMAFIGLFAVVFLLCRALSDKLLENNPPRNLLVDRVGGAVFGLATGYLVLGVCLIYAQMLPLPIKILGYQRFDKAGQVVARTFLKADEAVLGMYAMASKYSLGPGSSSVLRRYGDVNGDKKNDINDPLIFWQTRRAQYPAWKQQSRLMPQDPGGIERFDGIELKEGFTGVYRDVEIEVLDVSQVDLLEGFG